MKKAIHTTNAPEAIGPYSQAIVSNGLIFCSGQIPLNHETNELNQNTISDAVNQIMQNIKAILNAANSSLQNIVKTTIYLIDMNDFAEVNAAYSGYFNSPYPARSTVQVSALPKGARVEIEVIAIQ